MPITVLQHPVVQHSLSLLRAHLPPPACRACARDLCRFLTMEATRHLPLEGYTAEGWAGEFEAQRLSGKLPTAVPILRAGLGMLDGFLDILPNAPTSMVGLFRDEESLQPVPYHHKLVKDIHERTAFVLDPILATGGTTNATITLLKEMGCNKVCGLFLIASSQGIERIIEMHPDVDIYTCAVDSILTDKGFVLPGLGDAGDRIFGTT